MLYPPMVTLILLDSLLALNLATARASAYVAPPTMKTMIYAGFFEHSGVKPSHVGEYSEAGSLPLTH